VEAKRDLRSDQPRRLIRAAVNAKGTLPKLFCGVYQDGRLIGTVEQPDPREAYCAMYNHDAQVFGLSAKPLNPIEAAAAHKLLAEREGGAA
jgi:hypothetical protein